MLRRLSSLSKRRLTSCPHVLSTQSNAESQSRLCLPAQRASLSTWTMTTPHACLKAPSFQYTSRRSKVFVSRHNKSLNVSASSILEYCQSQGLAQRHKTTPTHVILRECPFCSKPTGGKISNLYKLYVENQSGAFFCHRCGNGGSWYDFKAQLGGYQLMDSDGAEAALTQPPRELPLPQKRLSGYYSSRLLDPQYADNNVLQYLTKTRGLERKTLRKYGVGRATYKFPSDQGYVEAECVTFPWILRESDLQNQEALLRDGNPPDGKKAPSKSTKEAKEEDPFITRRIKVRALQQKGWQRLDPPGGGWGLFGLHSVPADATEIVLTEGEYDAMAVEQATGRPAVSLPNGCRSLPVQVLPLLERFQKIYLWMDNDAPGQEGAEKFAKKLGLNRCYIVSCRDAKDANEALLNDIDMNGLIESAALVPHDRILSFADLRRDVLHELLQPDQYTGTPITSLPKFTSLIKGFRRGEMTVLTGPTGSGKTTFLGQLSLDLAEQGINCLWGSFEIKNTRLMHKLLKQFSREALPDIQQDNAAELLNALADRFEDLPLHFMRFHGGSEVDEVLDAMEYAVYVNDTEHIILDNMQFMITRNVSGGSTFDKFDVQDIAIEKFRKFATEHNVHLTLVVHPRKEEESSKLNMSSFYGSAKATQEADTVLILQHDGNRRKYVEVKKNRFDGTLGYAPLYFQSASGRYVDYEGGGSVEPQMGQETNFNFTPARNTWKSKQSQDPHPENLEKHWDNCLGTGRA